MLRRAKEDNQLAVDVAEYVKEHFHDPNLSVRMIAEEFSITPSYLTQKFKAVFRMGLLDYINYYRIEQTKKLILNSHVPFSDIAQRCGFASTATFTRLFKKYVGTVPSEFRKMGGGQG